jgi:hypothetical protein
VDGQLVALGHDVDDGGQVREVDLGVDALGVEVERERDEVDIAGPLAVAEDAALNPVAAGKEAELGCGDAGAAVIVRVERDDDV